MKAVPTSIPEVLILEPRIFGDSRGFFLESYNAKTFGEVTGLNVQFVQDNHSRSVKGVLRGLHYQLQRPQGKLVRVIRGRVLDVTVDLRRSSPHFGKWVGTELSEDNHRQFWVPAGFAHGFLVLSEYADFIYKTTEYYAPQDERSIAWNDPELGINWPLNEAGVDSPIISAKDAKATSLRLAETFD